MAASDAPGAAEEGGSGQAPQAEEPQECPAQEPSGGEGGEGSAQDPKRTKSSALSRKTAAEVLRQMEYYFSDSNLPRDKFMKEQILQAEGGYVPLKLLCAFSRMRKHLEVKDDAEVPAHLLEAVADVLRSSSSLLRVSADGQGVKREGPLPLGPEHLAEINARSVFVAPFEYCTRLEDLHSFFSQFGTVRSVLMRRHGKSKCFKGSVFVEMGSEEEMQKLAGRTGLMCNGVQLRLEPKADFIERIKRERVQRTAEGIQSADRDDGEDVEGFPLEDKEGGGRGTRGRQQGGEGGARDEEEEEEGEGDGEEGGDEEEDAYPKGLILAFTLKSTPAGPGPDAKSEVGQESAQGAPVEGDEGNPGEEAVAEGVTRVLVRNFFEKLGDVKFVEYDAGKTSGFVRFANADEAKVVAAKGDSSAASADMKLDEFVVSCRLLDGDEEADYWAKLRQGQRNKKQGGGYGPRGGRGGFRGGRGRGWRGRGGRGGFSRGRGRGGEEGGKGSHYRFQDE